MQVEKRTELPKQWFQLSTRRAVLGISRIWIPVFCLFILASQYPNPVVWLLVALAIGIFQYHLNILGHEGIHFLLSPNRKVNDFLSRYFLHGPHLAPLELFRTNHFTHHQKVGKADDPDRYYYGIETFTSSKLGLFFARAVLGLSNLDLIKKIGKRTRQRPLVAEDLISIGVSQLVIAGGILLITGKWYAYPLLWVVPLFTVMPGLNLIRSCLEHSLGHHQFSFVATRPERWVIAPFHMTHHWEHHRFVGVPYFYLPYVRQFLIENEDYDAVLFASYLGRWRAIAEELGYTSRDVRIPHST